MKKLILFISIFIISIFALNTIAKESNCDTVSARIGIQIRSDNKDRRAKGRDTLKADDKIRLYVIPDSSVDSTFVYVVNSDGETVKPLSIGWVKWALILPENEDSFYKVNSPGNFEIFTIICSPVELKDISNLLKTKNLTYKKWIEAENKLTKKGKLEFGEDVKKPVSIGGNVRSNISFIQELPTYSGCSILLKKYELKIKK